MLKTKNNFIINFIELKIRFCYYLLSFFSSFFILFNYKEELFYLLSKFLLNCHIRFIYTSLMEPLIVYIKLSIFCSLIITLPIFIYLFIFFFFKSFCNFKTIYWYLYLTLVYVIFLLFLVLFFLILLPFLFDFFISFQRNDNSDEFKLLLQATMFQYYLFIFNYVILFFLFLIIPNVFFVLLLSGFFNGDNFINFYFRKCNYLVVIIFFLLLSPPDFFIQLIILPIFLILLEVYIYILNCLYKLYLKF